VFFLVSFLIANTFLAYIIGLPELKKIITEPISEHVIGFFSIILFTSVFFIVYAFMREQICTVVCPYGRLQGVLLDKNTIVVAYDYVRGEPRGKVKKNQVEEKPMGDCIDCKACVHVCPTGIDIRNGTQLECVNCTACIDACDDIMIKINKPKGLIRYASENNISEGTKLKFSVRIMAYTGVLVLLLALLGFTFLSHSVVDVSVLRTPGQFYQENPDGTISNLYNFKVANKQNKPMDIKFTLEHQEGSIKIIGNEHIEIPAGEEKQGQLFVIMPQSTIKEKKMKLQINLHDKEQVIKEVSTTFMAPVN
jgi:cytochrome c oxidase accessory protein FixG